MAACLLPLVLASPAQTVHAGHGQKTGPKGSLPMPADRAGDSYAIYSMLMPGQVFASMSPEQNARWAIAEVTVNADDRNPAVPPQGQLKPPSDHARWFAEALRDYESNKNVRLQLTRDQFRISHDFSLLNPDEVSALRAAKTSTGAPEEAQTQWSGYPGVTFFSEVYFDSRHRAALVYMSDWCAQLCAAGSWVYLEKQNGRWVRRSGVVTPGA